MYCTRSNTFPIGNCQYWKDQEVQTDQVSYKDVGVKNYFYFSEILCPVQMIDVVKGIMPCSFLNKLLALYVYLLHTQVVFWNLR